MITYNYNNRTAPTGRFVIVDPGDYEFTVIAAEESLAATSGNQMVTLTLRLDGRGQGATIRDYLVFTDKALWKIDTFLKCIQEAPDVAGEMKLDPERFYGARGVAEIGQEPRKDDPSRKRNVVRSYRTTGPALDRDPEIARVPF